MSKYFGWVIHFKPHYHHDVTASFPTAKVHDSYLDGDACPYCKIQAKALLANQEKEKKSFKGEKVESIENVAS